MDQFFWYGIKMTFNIRTGDKWKNIAKAYLRTGEKWKQITKGYIRSGNQWKIFFTFGISGAGPSIAQRVTLSKTTNSGLITLTGRNYYWTNASSLSYVFQRSSNGGASWDPISSGTATNPSSGSSNTETYQLQDNKSDVYPNVDNLYRFVVTATSAGGSTTPSTSDNQSVSAARDISNLSVVSADTTFNSVKLQFTAGAYSSSYFVRYTYSGIQEGYFRSAGSGSPTTTITVTGLSPSTSYSFYVTPYTGGIVSGSNTGYGGNESSPVSATTSAVPTPIKVSSPTLSGNGAAQTSITAAGGSYQSGTFGFVTTKIVYYQSPYTLPVDGETSSSATIETTATPAPTYTIGQPDATTPNKKYYARDAVTNVAGTTTYYYYSNLVSAFIPTIIDTFNRNVASGLGISSSGYVYSAAIHQLGDPPIVVHEPNSWSTNGSVASSSATVLRYVSPVDPGSFAGDYPLKAIELTGKTNLTASVEIPSGGGGPGIAFWVSGAGSFWAIAPAYSKINSITPVTSTNCNGPVIPTNSTGTNPNCYDCPVTTSTSGGPSSDCNATAFNTNSTGTIPNCYSCPVTTSGGPSSDCNFPVNKSTDAQGTGCFGCPITTNLGGTSYTCGSGDTYNYGSAIVAQAACRGCSYSDTSYVEKTCNGGPAEYPNNTLAAAGTCDGKCSCGPAQTRTTYGCTGTTQNYSSEALCNASERVVAPYTAAMDGKRCSACVQPIAGVNLWRASAVAATSSTYYNCNTLVCTNVTQFSCKYTTVETPTTYTCRGQDTSTPISYTCKGRDTSTPVVTSYSCTGQQVTNNVTTSTYNTNLRIMSTVGSFVPVIKNQNINSNTTAFSKVYKISVTTSGDVITGTAYSDSAGTPASVLGTATYTWVSGNTPKASANGSSYAGIIKTPSAIESASVDNNPGSTFDNLSIS
jgi:hypothetical protein